MLHEQHGNAIQIVTTAVDIFQHKSINPAYMSTGAAWPISREEKPKNTRTCSRLRTKRRILTASSCSCSAGGKTSVARRRRFRYRPSSGGGRAGRGLRGQGIGRFGSTSSVPESSAQRGCAVQYGVHHSAGYQVFLSFDFFPLILPSAARPPEVASLQISRRSSFHGQGSFGTYSCPLSRK